MKDLKLLLYFLIFVVLLGAGFYAGFKFNDNKVTYVTDTVVVNKIDTFVITKWKPYKVIVDSIVRDSFYTRDTFPILVEVEVPLSKYNYSRTLIQDRDTAFIYQVIRGYGVEIDSLNLRLKTHQEIIVLKPSVNIKKRYSIGPSFSIGYDGEKIRPTVGLSFTFKLWEL